MEIKTRTPSVLPANLDQIYFNVEKIWEKRSKETGDCLTVSTILETITMRHSSSIAIIILDTIRNLYTSSYTSQQSVLSFQIKHYDR